MNDKMRATLNYHAGLSAENIVAETYRRQGHTVANQRWRGTHGEIDLVVEDPDRVVFIEVKKSRTHASADHRLGARQIARMMQTATEYVADRPNGQLTEMRFDLATVDQAGTVEIRENIIMAA